MILMRVIIMLKIKLVIQLTMTMLGRELSKKKQKWEENNGEYNGSENESEELESGCESDGSSGATKKRYPMFKLRKDVSNYKWELGAHFSTKIYFNEAITTFVVQSDRNLKFKKNDKQRVRVICKEGCEWEAYCANSPKEKTWQPRKVINNHTCSRDYNVKIITTKWLSERIQNSLKNNHRMKIKDIKEKAQRKWNVGDNNTKEIMATFAARDMVDGSFIGDYTRIYDYCHEILRTNSGSAVKLNVQPVQQGINDRMPHFKRL